MRYADDLLAPLLPDDGQIFRAARNCQGRDADRKGGGPRYLLSRLSVMLRPRIVGSAPKLFCHKPWLRMTTWILPP